MIGEMCVKHGIIILSDEMYEYFCYVGNFPWIATLSTEIGQHTITVGSVSKAFNVTGWRVGYAIGDAALIKHVQNAHVILSYTTACSSQWAAGDAIEMAERNNFYDQNRVEMRG